MGLHILCIIYRIYVCFSILLLTSFSLLRSFGIFCRFLCRHFEKDIYIYQNFEKNTISCESYPHSYEHRWKHSFAQYMGLHILCIMHRIYVCFPLFFQPVFHYCDLFWIHCMFRITSLTVLCLEFVAFNDFCFIYIYWSYECMRLTTRVTFFYYKLQ